MIKIVQTGVICEYMLTLSTALAAKRPAGVANVRSGNIRLVPFLIMVGEGLISVKWQSI